MEILLASQSPRRRALLQLLGLGPFQICPAKHEVSPDPTLPVDQALQQVALSKALEVQGQLAPAQRAKTLVIGADTMVCLDGHLLGKPQDLEEAREMLQALSGRQHQVYTALALLLDQQQVLACEQTDVFFRPLTAPEIASYLQREQVLDKAGAYAIQGPAAAFVERIEGDYSNIVGLPLCRLSLLLRQLGLEIFSEKESRP